ncbi:MAG: hypothetical protein O3B43_05105 [Chloroflexi bacterium]|nr:hypothetical protein [Chloroflexota bacterium]
MNFQNLSLDLRTFINTATIVALFFGLYSLWRGWSRVRSSGDLPYFRLHQQRLLSGWQLVVLAFLLLGAAGWLRFFGETTVYRIFPVTVTPSLTPTPSITPSPTLSPTLTLTPSETPTLEFTLTPSLTPIPQMPLSILALFESTIDSAPDAVFSPLAFSQGLNFTTYQAVNPGTVFQNPVGSMYTTFSYDQMINGVQWTALWYRLGDLVHFESLVWDGGTGGLGFSEWIPDAEEWDPGIYQVQIFVGTEPKVVGEFLVEGEPVTSTWTPTPTATPTPTFTPTSTPSITPTHTRFPTHTP